MTSVFKEVNIQQVSGGVVNFGNSLAVSPKTATKEPAGSGSINTGIWVITSSGFSCTNFIDPDEIDQKIINDHETGPIPE